MDLFDVLLASVLSDDEGGGTPTEADKVSYDSSKSGLSATKVQDAIDVLSVPYSEIEKKEDFVYRVSYPELDYEYADKYFNKRNAASLVGACSAVRNGRFVGRNFDWLYNNAAEFVVDVPAHAGRYATLGVCAMVNSITEEFVDSGELSRLYRILPFFMLDGINEYGLFCETNIVPKDYGENSTIPSEELRETINGTMLVRFILDRFKSAYEACRYISKHVSVWFSNSIHEMGYEQHYLLADKNSTYILEFRDNSAIYREVSNSPYMTNFYNIGVILNSNGTVSTPEVGDPVEDNGISIHGSGLERFNLIVNSYSGSNTKDGMRSLMDSLFFTRTYETSPNFANPVWHTEFVGGDLHCNSPVSEFAGIEHTAGQRFLERSRDTPNGTWQTVHSVLYDLQYLKMYFVAQEGELETEFGMGAISERVANLENNKVDKSDYNPVAKTSSMTQPVGKDEYGRLFTTPGGGNPNWDDVSEKPFSQLGASIQSIDDVLLTDSFVHGQETASNKWTVEHNLNKYPSVTVVDSANTVVIGDVNYLSLNKLEIIFHGVFSGTAYLN